MNRKAKNMKGDKKQRAVISVRGRVQKGGYRDLVAEIANGLNIGGIAENMPDGTVRIIAEAEKGTLEQFITLIEPSEDPMIKVTGIEVDFEPATNEFEYFDIKYGDFDKEGFERIGVAAVYLKRIDKKQDQMLGKQDQMLGKQDETISIIKSGVDEMREFRTETQQNFGNLDIKYGKIAENME
ncbi:MAG: acylphosphatase, partial [Candidatus Syntrophoarchaeum sp.]|nr:acylphosphatase [Candidatus Syntrophoarchaeum sp.]